MRRHGSALDLLTRLSVPLIALALCTELLALGTIGIVSRRGGFDSAYFTQAVSLITTGHAPFITIRGLHLLGDHFSPVVYLLAVPALVLPPAPYLMAVQALALGLSVFPLAAICRRHAHLGAGATAALLIGYALFPALHNINSSSFHPECLAVPAMLGAVLWALDRRWLPYGLCVAVILACREDIAITVAGLGLLIALTISRRAGLVTVAAALIVLLLDTVVLLPHFAGGAFIQAGQLARYGPSLGAQLHFMVSHPLRVADDLFTQQNLTFVVEFLGPLLFLPLVAFRWLAPAVPLQLLYLLSGRGTAHTILSQYTAHAVALAAVAAAFGLGAVTRPEMAARLARVMIPVALIALLVTSKDSPLWPSRPWMAADATDRARERAARVVPPGEAVSASERMLPLLAMRQDLYSFPGPLGALRPDSRWPTDRRTQRERADTTRWIVVDTADVVQWTGAQATALSRLEAQAGFRVVFESSGILVLQRQA